MIPNKIITIYKNGKYTIKRDGTSYYRVYDGRKRIGSFLLQSQAENYIQLKINLQGK